MSAVSVYIQQTITTAVVTVRGARGPGDSAPYSDLSPPAIV